MIKISNIETYGLEAAVRGMRNPMNSWDKSDSSKNGCGCRSVPNCYLSGLYNVGPNDLKLMLSLAKSGSDHAKFRRMIIVTMDILAPLYWWKEFDTYKVGTVANSCSTMHKIAEKEFTLEDFSHEHLSPILRGNLLHVIDILNIYRDLFVFWEERDDNTKNALLISIFDGIEYQKKDAWWQMIQLLPSSYNQLRTVQLNYEVLANIYHSRKDHKLDEWRELCKTIEILPYSEIITLKEDDK